MLRTQPQLTPTILPIAKPQDNDAQKESKSNDKESEQSSKTVSINFAGVSKVNGGSTNAILEAGKRILLQQSVMQRLQLQHVVTVKEKEKANDHLSMQQDVAVKPIPKVEASPLADATKPQTKKDVNVEKVMAPTKAITSNNSDNKKEAVIGVTEKVISVVEKTAKVDSTKQSELIKSADVNSNAPNNASKEQTNKLLAQIKQLAAKVTDKQEQSKDAKKTEVSKGVNKAAVKVESINPKPALVTVPVPHVVDDKNALQTKNPNLNASTEEKVIVKPTQKVEVSAAAATNKLQIKKEASDEKAGPIKATTSNNPDNKKEAVTTTTEKAEKVDPAKKNEIKNLLSEIQRVEVEKQIKGIQKPTENTKATSKTQAANSNNDYPEPVLIINK